MQIYKSGKVAASVKHRDSPRVPVEEELRFQGFKNQETEGPTRKLRGPAAQEPRLLEVLGMCRRKKKNTHTRPRNWGATGIKAGAEGSSACSHEILQNMNQKWIREQTAWLETLFEHVTRQTVMSERSWGRDRASSLWAPEFLQSNISGTKDSPDGFTRFTASFEHFTSPWGSFKAENLKKHYETISFWQCLHL